MNIFSCYIDVCWVQSPYKKCCNKKILRKAKNWNIPYVFYRNYNINGKTLPKFYGFEVNDHDGWS